MNNLDEQIEQIFENFDFNKVYKCMVTLDWTWASSDGTPSINELKSCAKRLLTDVSKKETDLPTFISTGGFKATKHEDGNLGLEFNIENWDYVGD